MLAEEKSDSLYMVSIMDHAHATDKDYMTYHGRSVLGVIDYLGMRAGVWNCQ